MGVKGAGEHSSSETYMYIKKLISKSARNKVARLKVQLNKEMVKN